ncbi:MAG: hypothetical protein NTY48_04535 [Candidatus Diapherotrites archaeon]|nr:hypothetical protein [Candidatus Diapherotrites archaeon]
MSKVYIKITNMERYAEKMGRGSQNDIIQVEKKVAKALIKAGAAELSQLERDMTEEKEEPLIVKVIPEVIEFLKRPDLLLCLIKEVQKKAIGEENVITTILLVVSLVKVKNKSPASANICLNGLSGAGKDFVVSCTLNLLPEEIVYIKRRVSEKAFDYDLARHSQRDWSQYVTYLEDVTSKVLNGASVKTLLSADPQKENIATIVFEGEAKNLKIKGKPVFIFTTAKSKLHEELIRRMPFCYLNESEAQTENILNAQARIAQTGETPEISAVAKEFFSCLAPIKVVIPFANDIAKKLAKEWIKNNPRHHVILRTVFARFLDYIKASVALHQHQRQKNEVGDYIATEEDYANARIALLATTNNILLIPLGRDQKQLLEDMRLYFDEGGTVQMIASRIAKWEERWLRTQLDNLAEQGFVIKKPKETEWADKPVAFYQVRREVFKFTIPTFKELYIYPNEEDEIINTNGTNSRNNTISTISTNGTKEDINCTNCIEDLFEPYSCANCKLADAITKIDGKLLCKNCAKILSPDTII